jgi:hypothetical protein
MSTVRRHALAVLAAGSAALLLAACGSDASSGPKPLTAAQDAAHYDSLAGALLAVGTYRDSLQAAAVEIISGVAAEGQTPSHVTVALNGTPAAWLASYANLVDSAATDSIQALSFWSDVNVDQYVVLFFYNGQFIQAQSIGSGGDLNRDSTATNVLTLAPASGACSMTSLVNVNSPETDIYTYDPSNSSCLLASASLSTTILFKADTTATGAIGSLSLSGQTVAGTRLQTLTGNTFPSRVTPPPITARRLR